MRKTTQKPMLSRGLTTNPRFREFFHDLLAYQFGYAQRRLQIQLKEHLRLHCWPPTEPEHAIRSAIETTPWGVAPSFYVSTGRFPLCQANRCTREGNPPSYHREFARCTSTHQHIALLCKALERDLKTPQPQHRVWTSSERPSCCCIQ